jgi:isopenicillin N synthase-like dioxygenase
MINLPTINLQKLSNPQLRTLELEKINRAMREYGFFKIRDSQLNSELREKLFKLSEEFFEKDKEHKSQFENPFEGIVRGYTASGKDSLSKTQSQGYGHDTVEKFVLALEREEAFFENVPQKYHTLFNRNIWPEQEEFRKHFHTYMEYLEELSVLIAQLLAESLEIDSSFFKKKIHYSPNLLRLNYYKQEEKKDENKQTMLGEHTDFGLFALLIANQNSGLEIKHNDEWRRLEHEEGEMIINGGDILAILTNDHYKSSLHRVSDFESSSIKSRTSIVYFVDGNHDLILEPIEKFISEKEPWRYRTCKIEEHFNEKIKAMETGSKSKAQITRE